MKVRAFETGSGVGGTWYWNRYPGARFDSQAEIYQYWFSEELYKSWQPSERFPAQPETERWLNHVADKLDLRKDIQFNTRITSAHYDEEVEYAVGEMTEAIGPILIVVLAAVVGFFALAIFMPMWDMTKLASGGR